MLFAKTFFEFHARVQNGTFEPVREIQNSLGQKHSFEALWKWRFSKELIFFMVVINLLKAWNAELEAARAGSFFLFKILYKKCASSLILYGLGWHGHVGAILLQNSRHFTGFLLMYLLCFVLFKKILENMLVIFSNSSLCATNVSQYLFILLCPKIWI